MTVSFVGAASAEATSLTLPAHQSGDLIVMLCYASGLGITVPAGWVHHQSRLQFSPSTTVNVSYRVAASSAEVSGTFPGTTYHLLSLVYRDTANYIILGGGNNNAGSSTGIGYPTLAASGASATGSVTMRQSTGWIVGFATGNSNATDINTQIPDVMTSRHVITGASVGESVAFDTNAAVASFAAQTKTITPTTQWYSVLAEILDTGLSKTAAGGGMLVHPGLSGGMRG